MDKFQANPPPYIISSAPPYQHIVDGFPLAPPYQEKKDSWSCQCKCCKPAKDEYGECDTTHSFTEFSEIY